MELEEKNMGEIDKRTLKKDPRNPRQRGHAYKVQRVVKVAYPRCDQDCPTDLGFQWWKDCPHDPYHSEDGNVNLRQVALEMKVSSNTGMERAYAKGAKLPEELGLKPYCQYRDCWAQDLKFNTRYGDFCSRDHAALVVLREEGAVIWAPFDEDLKKRRQQIDNVVLS